MTEDLKKRIEMINRGEVPLGYKKAFGGIVPCDYQENTLGDLFSFYGGLGIPRDKLGEEGIPYLHYGDIHRNSFMSVSYRQYSKLPKYNIELKGNETFMIENGDVIFLDASEDLEGTSRCVMVSNPENKPFISGLHTIIAKANNDKLIDEYKQYITVPYYIKKQFMQLSSGFKVYGINKNTISGIRIAYTKSHFEQTKISEILMKWDNAVRLQKELIEKLGIQKTAIMQKILIPKEEWNEIRVKDVFTITRGQVLAVDKCDDLYEYPVYSSQTLNNGLMGYYNEYLFENSITWTTDGANAGVVRYREGKFYCTNVCGVLLNNEGYSNHFTAYLLDQVTKNYVSYIGNPKLMNNVMATIKIKVPPLDEQNKISNLISVLNKKINLQEKKLIKLKEQRKAIMQLLLTGIVRVN